MWPPCMLGVSRPPPAHGEEVHCRPAELLLAPRSSSADSGTWAMGTTTTSSLLGCPAGAQPVPLHPSNDRLTPQPERRLCSAHHSLDPVLSHCSCSPTSQRACQISNNHDILIESLSAVSTSCRSAVCKTPLRCSSITYMCLRSSQTQPSTSSLLLQHMHVHVGTCMRCPLFRAAAGSMAAGLFPPPLFTCPCRTAAGVAAGAAAAAVEGAEAAAAQAAPWAQHPQ
jgi:hypothetical protein